MSTKDVVEGIGSLFVWLWELIKAMYASEGFFYGVLAPPLSAHFKNYKIYLMKENN